MSTLRQCMSVEDDLFLEATSRDVGGGAARLSENYPNFFNLLRFKSLVILVAQINPISLLLFHLKYFPSIWQYWWQARDLKEWGENGSAPFPRREL